MSSDVQRLREQIDAECEALNLAFNGYAAVSSHEAIQARYNNIGAAQEELAQFVGEEEARSITFETYSRRLR